MYMPKVDIDYSNTIFYKIFCKDPTIKELYVGLTTNFVQRRHAHKQSCKNEKAVNHNCKLYKTIRNVGGWDNWQMEIIAFHNCKDSREAHKKEQEYFEALGATLNSIEPFPKPKIKEHTANHIKEKAILYCEPCGVYFSHWKLQETHNNTKKHVKLATLCVPHKTETNKCAQNIHQKYVCEKCEYSCAKKSCWVQHLLTSKHQHANLGLMPAYKEYVCEGCQTNFAHQSSYCRHKKKCGIAEKPDGSHVKNNTLTNSDDLISVNLTPKNEHKNTADIKTLTNMVLEVVKKNQELMNQNNELQKHIIDLCKKGINNALITKSHNNSI